MTPTKGSIQCEIFKHNSDKNKHQSFSWGEMITKERKKETLIKLAEKLILYHIILKPAYHVCNLKYSNSFTFLILNVILLCLPPIP